jgi:hypothetical protein
MGFFIAHKLLVVVIVIATRERSETGEILLAKWPENEWLCLQ